jgi:hypothetical protein
MPGRAEGPGQHAPPAGRSEGKRSTRQPNDFSLWVTGSSDQFMPTGWEPNCCQAVQLLSSSGCQLV